MSNVVIDQLDADQRMRLEALAQAQQLAMMSPAARFGDGPTSEDVLTISNRYYAWIKRGLK